MTIKPAMQTARLFLIALLIAIPARAEEQQVSVRALALVKGEMPEWHVQVGEDKYAKLEWSDTQPSVAITAQAGEALELFSKAANEDGTAEYKAALKVQLPESAKEVLLLGTPAENGGEAGAIAIADSFSKAEFSDWLVINRSENQVTLRLGKNADPVELEAGESKIYKIASEGDKGEEVIAHEMIKGESRMIYSTFWSASTKQRSLVLFYTKDNRTKVRRIIDFLPAASN